MHTDMKTHQLAPLHLMWNLNKPRRFGKVYSHICQHVGMTTCLTLPGCVPKIVCEAIDNYSCLCIERGWEGHDCEIDVDECISAPCQNGATCVDSVSSCALVNGSACEPVGMVPGHNGCMYRPMLDSFACQCAHGWVAYQVRVYRLLVVGNATPPIAGHHRETDFSQSLHTMRT